ncbi:MAG: MgtC/SapB family protein [Rhizobiaceae bacterium]|nr:MgtC/SapB family protein [Rhizobiaceae bacterium]
MDASHSILLKLVTALLLGTLIGAERHLKQRNSNLVTHALVALGAASYASLPSAMGFEFDLRMGAQVITGIGFLGAGLIIRDGTNIKGLSTAATVWSTGAVGVFAGYGQLLLAVEAAIFIVAFNYTLPKLGRYIEAWSAIAPEQERIYDIKLKCPMEHEIAIRAALLQSLNASKLQFRSIKSRLDDAHESMEIEAIIFSKSDEDGVVEQLVAQLSLRANVEETSWSKTNDDSS